jgi:hypothetical protein
MDSPFIDEFRASFYVLGGTIHPSEITERLQIEPDLIHEKGNARSTQPEKPTKIYPKHLWRFSSPPMPDDEQKIRSHIEFILQAIEQHSTFLMLLAKDAELYLEVDCRLDERFRSTSYEIDQSLLARLAKLQVSIGHVFRLATNDRAP